MTVLTVSHSSYMGAFLEEYLVSYDFTNSKVAILQVKSHCHISHILLLNDKVKNP